MKVVGIIPSRYDSSRLPGKPLADINGKPMVWWVYNQAKRATALNEVYVATDDQRIIDVCNSFGIPSIMTSRDHNNGTERLSEVATNLIADIYVTIQGDEPLLEPSTINEVVNLINSHPEASCATLKTPYKNPVDVINGTTPKVVTDLNDYILLFTRSPVPYPKAALDYVIYKPLGIYAFRRDALLCYSTLKIGPLEKIEEIELLRFIENGYKVKISEVSSETVAVDTYKDLERVREIIKNKLKHGEK